MGILSFPQVVYLIKEMMIGFEVLIDIFGCFDPNERLIAVNERNQWKFWISKDFSLNSK
jgi:hypothetical protein